MDWSLSPPSARETDSRPGRQAPYLRIQSATIFVHDQDRSIEFYVDQLGFSVAFDYRTESGERWVGVAPPDGDAILVLVRPKPDSEQYRFIDRPWPVVFVTEDIVATFEDWNERGVRFHHAPQVTDWGGTFSRFEDLDGNSFTLVGFDEMTQQIEA